MINTKVIVSLLMFLYGLMAAIAAKLPDPSFTNSTYLALMFAQGMCMYCVIAFFVKD